MTVGTPLAEHTINPSLVRGLLREQHPDLADVAIQLIDVGWDNVIYRLGDDYAVRLPRRREAAVLVEHEQAWLPVLADRLPIPIPAPVRIGHPGNGYPWPWSIVPWLPGVTANLTPPNSDQSRPLAEFLRALHLPAPGDAPRNTLRGVPLQSRAKAVEDRLERLRSVLDVDLPKLLWILKLAIEASESKESCWLHGDLHARNVLVSAGKIAGIVDWGDITSGDVATDVATVWMLFDEPEARNACLEYYQAGRDLLARAKGWAVFLGTVLLETGLVDHQQHAAMGRAALQRLCEDT